MKINSHFFASTSVERAIVEGWMLLVWCGMVRGANRRSFSRVEPVQVSLHLFTQPASPRHSKEVFLTSFVTNAVLPPKIGEV